MEKVKGLERKKNVVTYRRLKITLKLRTALAKRSLKQSEGKL